MCLVENGFVFPKLKCSTLKLVMFGHVFKTCMYSFTQSLPISWENKLLKKLFQRQSQLFSSFSSPTQKTNYSRWCQTFLTQLHPKMKDWSVKTWQKLNHKIIKENTKSSSVTFDLHYFWPSVEKLTALQFKFKIMFSPPLLLVAQSVWLSHYYSLSWTHCGQPVVRKSLIWLLHYPSMRQTNKPDQYFPRERAPCSHLGLQVRTQI